MRKQSKAAEENEFLRERLQEIEQQAKIGAWELDIRSNILFWSDYVYKIFEVAPEDFSGTLDAFLERVHPEDRTLVHKAYSDSVENKTPYEIVHRLKLDSDTVKYVREWCRTSYDEDGNPLISYGTVQDITQQVLEEEEKKKVANQVFQLSQMAALGELASGVAHEINNPLSILNGYYDLVTRLIKDQEEECPFVEQLKEYVSGARNALERIGAVVQSLKSYNHIDTARKIDFNVAKEVKSSVDFIKSVYERDGILIQYNNQLTQDIFIAGYPNYFQQVLMNLYSNSRDALEGRDGAYIYINCWKDKDNIIISVEDNGGGIPEDIQNKIFEFSFTTKEVGKGTGFGLHLVKEFVEKMSGSIRVESKVNQGTTFFLTFPISKIRGLNEQDELEKSLVDGKCTGKLSFLVVDDEVDIAEYLATLLEFEGHDVDFVTSAKEVLEKIKEKEYDAIFTDIVMPEMNGQTLLRKLTQEKYNGKRIIVSGNFFPQGKSAVMRYDEIMDKPFTAKDVHEVLLKLFGN